MKIRKSTKAELRKQIMFYHFVTVIMSALLTVLIYSSCNTVRQTPTVALSRLPSLPEYGLFYRSASSLEVKKFNACKAMSDIDGRKQWDCSFHAERPAYIYFLSDQNCRYIQSRQLEKGLWHYQVLCAEDKNKINRTLGINESEDTNETTHDNYDAPNDYGLR